MTPDLVLALSLSALCGLAAAGLYLAWPRRMTAEEWVIHRRAASATFRPPPEAQSGLEAGWGALLARHQALVASARADLALLSLAGEPAPANQRDLLGRLAWLALAGGLGGLLLALLALATGGAAPSALLLPACGGLLLPAWYWLGLRRGARRLRAGVERHLPRLLVAARVMLESGAATPEGALIQATALHGDLAADVLGEALRLRVVQRVALEAALEAIAERYGVPALGRLADSFRIGGRYGTQMAQLLGEHARHLRQGWFSAYRERITRAPVVMTLPALVFFVAPLLVLILFLVFTPLVAVLRQL